MLRACSPCASDAAAFGGGPACPGGPACAAADAQTLADDACSGDASSSRSQPTPQQNIHNRQTNNRHSDTLIICITTGSLP